jgi:ubiquinone/menaquinone biosynthesis C-methylase UbiE
MSSRKYEKAGIRYSVTRNNLIGIVPKPILNIGLRLLCIETDAVDFLLKRKDCFTPPCKMRIQIGPFVDARYYESNAQEFFDYLKNVGRLKPSDYLLDVGCGYGQLVSPLSKYLDQDAKYEGFDIASENISWCKENISSKISNFHFKHADVFNSEYNPEGKQKASQYKFPYADESFDIVFLKSVFTHMLPPDVNNYLNEIFRVLKKNGKCLISYFLINGESNRLIKTKESPLSFSHIRTDCRVNDKNTPEIAVAYDEEYVRTMYANNGLKITEPIKYGSWCGRRSWLSYQDIILALKKEVA